MTYANGTRVRALPNNPYVVFGGVPDGGLGTVVDMEEVGLNRHYLVRYDQSASGIDLATYENEIEEVTDGTA